VVNKAARRGTEAGARVLFGKTLSSGGLIFGSIVGDFLNLVLSIFQYKRSEGTFKDIEYSEVKENLKEHEDFPKYALFPAVLNVVSSYLPVFLLSSFYSDSVVGQFDGTREILSVPLALVSISISQVLYQRLTEDINAKQPILQLLRKNALFLTVLGAIGILIFYPFGRVIFQFIYGENWGMAGDFSSILVFSFAIRFIVSPLSIVFTAVKKLKTAAIWQICYFLLTINLLWMEDIKVESFLYFIVLFDLIAYSFYLIMIFRTAKKQDDKLKNEV
jgi:O-antigen/teichoic acid export membrane protein